MSPSDADPFTDMDGNAIEDCPEPLRCPFCGSGGDQLVVERWSEEDDPDASYHERSVVTRRGRRKTVCARGAWVALLGGPSTSPLGLT